MSYARRAATKRTPAMQAALDKRAAMMLRVHEARVSGDMTDATIEAVNANDKLVQNMDKLVTESSNPPDNDTLYSQLTLFNFVESYLKDSWQSVSAQKMPEYGSIFKNPLCSYKAPEILDYYRPQLSSFAMQKIIANARATLSLRYDQKSQDHTIPELNELDNMYANFLKKYYDEDDDETPHPLSISTFPTQYFLPIKSGR
ncbi:hypothetical protein NLN85_22225 [Citrobacter portucalensis]|uniref:hypothetical protein n=1 Tax=Citrobacter portucalensis TaxID=1639133 RepID=UPI00226BA4F7|nr:hypothetical protein [Citrobacter portucalensis]MCX8995196.1 hypothetical protein [Citrobacter portucalensis]